MGKSMSVLVEERRDLKTDLKGLRRNRLYLQERIQECVNGINQLNTKIDAMKLRKGIREVTDREEREEESRSDSEVFNDLLHEIGEDYVTVEVEGDEDRIVDLRTGRKSHPKERVEEEEIEDEEK